VRLAAVAVEHRAFTVFATVIILVAGIAAFGTLGQLEDPEFTVKNAVVTTTYPGATAEEVELEVTDRIELAIQEMPEVKEIESFSRAGLSLVKITILPQYKSADLPQVWDVLRKKMNDVEPQLPPGAGPPTVGDDFGDVYGLFLAIVSDGFTHADVETYADKIKKELSLVDGVARVELWGVQQQCIYVDISEAQITRLGIAPLEVQQILSQQNIVVDAGGLDVLDQRLRIETTGEFSRPEDIENLILRGRSSDPDAASSLVRIGDVATVRRGYVEPPHWEMRVDGLPAIGLSLSNVSGANVVTIGEAVDRRLAELTEELPVGIELKKISWQSDEVNASIVGFMISLAQAVGIVLVILWLFMGLRTALIVGLSGLVFTIIASFVFMKLFGIDLQRMSLGALIIAMGMMVDNAIVVADGVLVRMQKGMDRVKAAVEAASQPAIPLLGATIIAVLAFYPIAASDEGAGEYCATLFSVVAISLMISWVLSVTVAPVMCIALLPTPKQVDESEMYGGRFYGLFRGVLGLCLKVRWLVLLLFVAVLVASGVGFGWVEQMFFPASARAQFMVDYWAPEGTRIQQTSAGLARLEATLMNHPEIASVNAFVGQGPPRFYLPVDPEFPYASYGQLIVNVHDYRSVDGLMAEINAWSDENMAEARVVPRKYGLGPSETWAVQARISGPAIADARILRALGEEGARIAGASPHAAIVRTNWRQRSKKVVADYDEVNARWTSVSRSDIARTMRRAYDGFPLGVFRDKDKLLPILGRNDEEERRTAGGSLETLQVRPPLFQESIPLGQVTKSIDVEWEDPLIWRWDRRRSITIQAVPIRLATTLRNDILDGLESLELPAGFELEWDGEFANARDAQASLIPGIIPAVALIALIVVALFNAYRPPLVIAFTIPFALIGVTIGLLATGQPFGFVALLGAMSLAGMMIKNAIVLLDQINIEKAEGKSDYDAVIGAAVSRLRPVVLAAATTVLGVIPLPRMSSGSRWPSPSCSASPSGRSSRWCSCRCSTRSSTASGRRSDVI
jgi:multidrug efflux pump subunit AcrB